MRVNIRRILRVTLAIVVIGSLISLPVYADLTDLAAGAQAPLFALIAALGLAVGLRTHADQSWEKALNILVRVTAVAAALFSAFLWLQSVDAGTGLEVVGAVGAVLAVVALLVNLDDVEAET